jgi:hypothetical protein
MRIPFSFMSQIGGSGGAACSDVTFSPSDGAFGPLNVTLSTTTSGASIFYRLSNIGDAPVHSGGTATSPTVKISSNSGIVGVSTVPKTLKAVAYRSDLADSAITEAQYSPPEGGA